MVTNVPEGKEWAVPFVRDFDILVYNLQGTERALCGWMGLSQRGSKLLEGPAHLQGKECTNES